MRPIRHCNDHTRRCTGPNNAGVDTEHRDLGATYFDRRPMEHKANRLAERLRKPGFNVQLQPFAEVA
jgi:hypothetical protein